MTAAEIRAAVEAYRELRKPTPAPEHVFNCLCAKCFGERMGEKIGKTFRNALRD